MRALGSSFERDCVGLNANEEFAFRLDRCSFPLSEALQSGGRREQ